MTDQTKAVAALAEAMEPLYTDPVLVYTIQGHARRALQAIQAKPDILREYGIGRLPTRSELMACREVDASTGYPVRVFGDDAVDYLVEAGWAIEDPDPQPPEPTLPSVLGRIMYESVKPCLWEGASDYQKTLFIHQAEALLAEFDITPKAPRP